MRRRPFTIFAALSPLLFLALVARMITTHFYHATLLWQPPARCPEPCTLPDNPAA
jgi:hypothetical protein